MNSERFDEERLTSGLKLLAEDMESLNAPPEIEMRLREAFRARAVFARRRSYVNYWVAGIAAVLLIAISVIAINWRTDTPKQVTADRTEPAAPVKEQPRIEEPQQPQQQEVV